MGIPGAGWVITILVFLVVVIGIHDAIELAPYKAWDLTCQNNLKKVGGALRTYRAEHRGAAPPNIKALIPYLDDPKDLLCPLTQWDEEPKKHRSYTCRFTALKNPTDAVCWDRRPQVPFHPVLRWQNRPVRNVLFADGKTRQMYEEDFKKLGVQGVWLALP